jgi:hypothetical protein
VSDDKQKNWKLKGKGVGEVYERLADQGGIICFLDLQQAEPHLPYLLRLWVFKLSARQCPVSCWEHDPYHQRDATSCADMSWAATVVQCALMPRPVAGVWWVNMALRVASGSGSTAI